MQFTAQTIADFVGGTVLGDASAIVETVAKIEEATAGTLAFLSNPKYEDYLYSTGASIVIVANDFVPRQQVNTTLIKAENPYMAFASLLNLYIASKPKKEGVSALAAIHASATIAADAYVGAFSVIDSGASVAQGAQIYPQVYVGDGVKIGKNVKLFPGVKIYEQCVIGDNVTIHSGTVIGGDGFGFAPTEDGSYQKIPQIGNVIIEDDVEIGANSCIDRATMGSTIIRRGVKLDNLIQIAHNVVIGENSVIAAQTGVAGSSKVGAGVMMGGQVGIVGHLTIADHVKIGSQSGVNHDLEHDGQTVLGSPAIAGLQHHRAHAIFKELPSLRSKVLDAVREIEKLKQELSELKGDEISNRQGK